MNDAESARSRAVKRAKEIVTANEWEGDLRSNMTTVIGAGRVLAKRIDELEKALRNIVAHQDAVGGQLARLSSTRLIALNALGDLP